MIPSENDDYYMDESGRLVFTAAYHLRRGTCCENGCRHCPYGFGSNDKPPASGQDDEK